MLTHQHLKRSVTYRRMLTRCPFFEPLVKADATSETLSYMPSLLSWELDTVLDRRPSTVVVFLDTFEAISGRDTRAIERLIQRMIFLMPNVMFVVTSRNRLDWVELEAANELDYVGAGRWPQLSFNNVTQEPRQHLIGALSSEDCESYLLHVLHKADGSPALDPDLRAAIIGGSGGLPLYLDLSVTHYLELVAAGQPVAPDAFGGPLSSVVARIMRNLDQEERNLLRGVSLLDSFDVDLARAASGAADSTIARFINCSFVVRTSGLPWPYALHALLRECIQETDHELRDAWSQREWRLAAERICDHLRELSIEARRQRNRSRAANCFTQAMRLAVRFELLPSWIIESAQFLADSGLWSMLDVRLPTDPSHTSPAAALVEGLRGIALRRSGSLEESVRSFDFALSSTSLGSEARDLLRLHRAHSLRNSGRYDKAQPDYEVLARDDGVYADRARLQLADLHLLRGQFRLAIRALEELPDDPDTLGESLRIRGHVHRFNCDLETAELTYRRALDLAQDINSLALEGKARTNLAETLCWMDPLRGERLADEAIEFNSSIGNQLEVLKAYAAKAVTARGPDADQIAEKAIGEALRLAESCQYRAGTIFALAARLFHQAGAADGERALSTAEEIYSRSKAIGVYKFWREIVRWWITASGIANLDQLPPIEEPADWLGLPELAQKRWIDRLKARAQAS